MILCRRRSSRREGYRPIRGFGHLAFLELADGRNNRRTADSFLPPAGLHGCAIYGLVPLAVGYFLVVRIAAPLLIADRFVASGVVGMMLGIAFLAIALASFPAAKAVER